MDKAFWIERWERNQIGFHLDQVNPHLERFWDRLGVSRGRVFVPLCGKSLDMLWLLGQGHEVMGVEISGIAARDFFRSNGLLPERTRSGDFEVWRSDGLALFVGDFFELPASLLEGVAAVYDRASLVALPPSMRPAYAAHLEEILPQRMPVLLVSLEYDESQMQGPPFPVHEDEVRDLYGDSHRIEVLYDAEVIDENPGLAAKGLTSLREKVYLLRPGD